MYQPDLSHVKRTELYRGIVIDGLPVFTSAWKTDNLSTGSSTSTQVKLPLTSAGNYDFLVDWGDDSTDMITAWDQTEVTHTYSSAGTYTIKITGTITGWSFNNTGDRLKIIGVSNWGTLNPGNIPGQFYGTSNMVVTATNHMGLGGVTNMASMFRNSAFNQPINTWDVSAVGGFLSMFEGSDFNQPIGSWDITNAPTLTNMFAITDFDQDISGWNTSGVTNMSTMFFNTPFNQSIDAWDVTSVQLMNDMFHLSSYNKALNSWVPSSVTNFSSMFRQSVFNQPIGAWTLNSTGPVNMFTMFRDCPFNQAINAWDVSAVTNMTFMFFLNTAFDQDLSGWDVSSVTVMGSMFRGATGFDQDLGAWDIVALTDATGMFQDHALSTANYDALLIGWEANTHNTGVTFHAGTSTYSAGAAATARADLVTDTWAITDGGPA